jgi:nitrogen regulatory protein PII
MKKIEAILRISRFEEVCEALHEVVRFFYLLDVTVLVRKIRSYL